MITHSLRAGPSFGLSAGMSATGLASSVGRKMVCTIPSKGWLAIIASCRAQEDGTRRHLAAHFPTTSGHFGHNRPLALLITQKQLYLPLQFPLRHNNPPHPFRSKQNPFHDFPHMPKCMMHVLFLVSTFLAQRVIIFS